jgi:uncharacterized damage-inducible protein DinB
MKPYDLFSHWDQIREGLISTIKAFSEEELIYTPYPGSWSVGKIILHIAGAEDGWLRHVVTRELDKWPEEYTLENYPSIEAILQVLDEVHARTTDYLGTLEMEDISLIVETPWDSKIPLLWIIWHVVEHEIHHRGELSLILGILGREGLDV